METHPHPILPIPVVGVLNQSLKHFGKSSLDSGSCFPSLTFPVAFVRRFASWLLLTTEHACSATWTLSIFFRFLYLFLLCRLFFLRWPSFDKLFFCFPVLFPFPFFPHSGSLMLSFLQALTSRSLMDVLVLVIADVCITNEQASWDPSVNDARLSTKGPEEREGKRVLPAVELAAVGSRSEHSLGSGLALRISPHFLVVTVAPTWEWPWW